MSAYHEGTPIPIGGLLQTTNPDPVLPPGQWEKLSTETIGVGPTRYYYEKIGEEMVPPVLESREDDMARFLADNSVATLEGKIERLELKNKKLKKKNKTLKNEISKLETIINVFWDRMCK